MLELETSFLKDLISRASKGAGKDKLLAKSELVFIKVENNEIRLFTTDGSTDLEIVKPFTYEGKFSVVTDITPFQRLIEKTTTKTVKLEMDLERSVLSFEGNGSYEFPIYLEGGRPVSYPILEIPDVPSKTLSVETLRTILKLNGGSVSKDLSIGIQYSGYYFYPNGVDTSDRQSGCRTLTDLDVGSFMLPARTMNLLDSVVAPTVEWFVSEGEVVIKADDMIIYSQKMEHAVMQRFPHETLNKLLEDEFSNKIVVNRNELIQAVERLIVFRKVEFGVPAITLHFDKDFLGVLSGSGTGIETIYCERDEDRIVVDIMVNGELLKSLLQTCQKEMIDICYNAKVTEDGQADLTSAVIVLKEENTRKFMAKMIKTQVQQG